MNARRSCIMVFLFFMLINCAMGSIDEGDRELVSSNFPYGRGLDNELLARILMLPQRLCHSKRNSELINSILGLPKNMNNAGK